MGNAKKPPVCRSQVGKRCRPLLTPFSVAFRREARMSKAAGPAKKTSTVAEPPGQYTWRVRRKLDGADTPWKQGGPAEIMEVVLRRLEVLENFEKSTKEIERRINNLDKNILAVAKTIMPRPPGAPAPPPVQEPILDMADEPKKVAAG